MNPGEGLSPQLRRQFEEAVLHYLQAAKAGAPPDREEWIAQHPQLADHLRSFFAAQDQKKKDEEADRRPALEAETLVSEPAATSQADADRDAPEDHPSGQVISASGRFGDYELIEEIARGGMGVVYKARQVSLNRVVALKMILTGRLAGKQDVQRFYAEAEAAANLDHPGIVPVYEVGLHDGQHFFSMGFVEGQSLAKKTTAGPLPPREAAELVRTIAEAIAFAHQRGVIHRDLKPGNVLLDADGHPRITDFGLAKRTQRDSQLTGTGQILGTPSYMPPEQAAGKTDDVTPLADVYALGAILYALLVGRPPFQAASVMETLRQVLERDPLPPRQINAHVPRDLETICLKCLRKEPLKRYESAQALADDLRRYLRGEPIVARPVGRVERAVKWVRRRPAVSFLIAAVAMSLIVGTTVSTYFAIEAGRRADEADRRAISESKAKADAVERLWGSYLAQAQARRWSGQSGRRFEALAAIRKAAEIRASPELRNEAIAVLGLADVRPGRQWQAAPGDTHTVEFTADLATYARSDARGTIRVRLTADQREVARLPGPGGRAWVMRISGDGRFLGAKHHRGASSYPSRFHVWDVKRQAKILEVPDGILNAAAAFDSSGRRLAVAGRDTLRVYQLPEGKQTSSFRTYIPPHSLAWDPGGNRLAISSLSNRVNVVDAETGRATRSLSHPEGVRGVAWHPSGNYLAAAGADANVYLWDMTMKAPREPRAVLRGHQSVVTEVAFNRAGNLLASVSWDGFLVVWDAFSGEPLIRLGGLQFEGKLRFSTDDRQLAGWRVGRRLGLWEVADGLEHRRLPGDKKNRIWDAALSADGRLLAVGRNDGLHLWDLPSLKRVAHLSIDAVRSVFFQDQGENPSLITWGVRGLLRWKITRPKGAAEPLTIGAPQELGLSAGRSPEWGGLSADGQVIAVGDRGRGEVVAFDLAKKKVLLREKHANPSAVAISPDGRWLAAGTWGGLDNRVRVWDIPGEKCVRQWKCSAGTTVAFDAFGGRLVLGEAEEYRIIEVGSWRPLGAIPKQSGGRRVCFSRDGRLLALSLSSGSLRLLDAAATAAPRDVATLPGGLGVPVCFSRDGGMLVAYGRNNSIEVWDLRSVREQLTDMNLGWTTGFGF